MRRLRVPIAVACVLVVSGCTHGNRGAATPSAAPSSQPSAQARSGQPRTTLPADTTMVLGGGTAAEIALGTSRALYAESPSLVLVAADDTTSLGRGATTAVELGVPLLLSPAGTVPSPAAATPVPTTGASAGPTPGTVGATPATNALRAELSRLGAQTIVTVGSSATAWGHAWAGGPTVVPLDGAPVPPAVRPEPLTDLLVLALDRPVNAAAVATARASGARVVLTAGPDPRTSDAVIKALAGQPTGHILAIDSTFGPAPRLRSRVETAATGAVLPGGGQVVFPGRRLVALYGHPGNALLGSLGEQSMTASIARAKQVAGVYQSLVKEPVAPTFEIIATIASRGAGADGNYSSESPVSLLRPWLDAARNAGIYVILDLQPGRTDFLTQAKLYSSLLMYPNVGLALDPEWRLKPDQVHLVQTGSVSADEINQTASWLAEFTREHKLPQKVLMVHQFRLDMVTGRSGLRTDFDELSVVIHADGFGSAGQKFNTWRGLRSGAPAGVFWGWKNFYDEDKPTFTPNQTVAISPSPLVITYQ